MVKALESGSVTLEKSIKIYSHGQKLVKLCSEKIDQAKLQVEKVIVEDDAIVGTERLGEKKAT